MNGEPLSLCPGAAGKNMGAVVPGPAYLQAIINSADVAIVVVNRDGLITLFNAGAERMLGYSADEMVGLRNPIDFHCLEHLAEVCEQEMRRLGRVVQLNEVFTLGVTVDQSVTREWCVICKGGVRKTVRITMSQVQEDEVSVGFIGVMVDISDQVVIRTMMTRQNALFANGPMVAFGCSTKQPNIIRDISPNVLSILGYSSEQIIFHPQWWAEHLHPDDRDELSNGRWRLNGDGYFVRRRFRLRHALGYWCWLDEYSQLASHTEVLGYWVDITQQMADKTKLEKIATNIPGIIFQYKKRLEHEGRFSYISEGVHALHGARAADVRESASLFFAAIHHDDRERVLQTLHLSAHYLQSINCEYRIRLPDGTKLWAELHATPERAEDDEVVWHGFIAEITTRKRIEQALQNGQERLDLALKSADMGLWDWHIPSEKIEYNGRWASLLGCGPGLSSSLGELWEQFIYPDDLQEVKALMAAHLAGESEQFEAEYRVRHQDGYWMWVIDRGRITERDDEGRPVRMVGTVQDITDRKQANLALQASEAYFRTLFLNHEAVMLLIDPSECVVVDANPSACRFYGYLRSQLVGMSVTQINALPASELRQLMTDALTDNHNHFVFQHKMENGELKDVDVYSSPVESGGKVLLFSIIHDITERRRVQNSLKTTQQQLLSVIENFHGGVVVENDKEDIVFVNHQFCRMFCPTSRPESLRNISRKILLTQIGSHYLSREQREKWTQSINDYRQPHLGLELSLTDGREVEVDYVPVLTGQVSHGGLWVCRDISERKRYEKELLRMATTDVLTGVANRRYFQNMLSEEFARFQRTGEKTSVLMLDIDHFKQVNDSYGHAMGDEVIRRVAHTCMNMVRKVDKVGRLGGEEFAIILPGCDLPGAVGLAERLRMTMLSLDFIATTHVFHISISVGVAMFEPGQQDGGMALNKADKALYVAKQSGRNRVYAIDATDQFLPGMP